MLALIWFAAAAHAGGPQYIYERLGAAINPLGLSNDLRVEWRTTMPWEQKGSLLLDGTYLGGGFGVEASPAYVRAGPRLSWQPVAFFDVQAQARFLAYYGTYDDLMPFDDPNANYDDPVRTARAADAHPAIGMDFDTRPEVKFKVGPVFAVDNWEMHYYLVPGDHPYVYEPYFDLLIGRHDFVYIQDVLVGAFPWQPDDHRSLLVAAMSENAASFATKDSSWNVGPLVAFTPSSHPAVPTFVVLARMYLKDRIQTKYSVYGAVAVRWVIEHPPGKKS